MFKLELEDDVFRNIRGCSDLGRLEMAILIVGGLDDHGLGYIKNVSPLRKYGWASSSITIDNFKNLDPGFLRRMFTGSYPLDIFSDYIIHIPMFYGYCSDEAMVQLFSFYMNLEKEIMSGETEYFKESLLRTFQNKDKKNRTTELISRIDKNLQRAIMESELGGVDNE